MAYIKENPILDIAKMIACIGVVLALWAGWLFYSFQQKAESPSNEITVQGHLKELKYNDKHFTGTVVIATNGEDISVNVNHKNAFMLVAFGNTVEIANPKSERLIDIGMPVQATYFKGLLGNGMVELTIGKNFHLKRVAKAPISENYIYNANLLLIISLALIFAGIFIHLFFFWRKRNPILVTHKTTDEKLANVIVDGKSSLDGSLNSAEFKDSLLFHGLIWLGFSSLFYSFMVATSAIDLRFIFLTLPWLVFLYFATIVKTEYRKSNPVLTTPHFADDMPIFGKYIKAYVYVYRGFKKHTQDSLLAIKSNPFQGFLSLIAYFYPIFLLIIWFFFPNLVLGGK